MGRDALEGLVDGRGPGGVGTERTTGTSDPLSESKPADDQRGLSTRRPVSAANGHARSESYGRDEHHRSPLRRSRRMTHLCSGKVTRTENTIWRAPTTVCD